MGSQSTIQKLKKKAPQIIIIAIALTLCTYILLEFLMDAFIAPLVNGHFSFTRTIASLGYGGVFGLMLLEASSLPIPSEAILPFAGYLVSTGHLDLWITLTVATIAALAGSLIDYFIGLKGVQVLTKYRILGHAIFSENQLKVAACYFSKYGSIMVFIGRLIPVVRTLISFPAGAVRMPIAKFIGYTLAGCFLWNGLLLYIGYYLGTKWQEVANISHYLIIAIVAIAAVSFIAYMIRRRKKQKKAQQKQTNKPN
ncbi:MAG TPA: DedA family protein [Candidatus Acidoferrales bacterium]|nr:DedA family protein [Candidatus Acidoferrales bacterium]